MHGTGLIIYMSATRMRSITYIQIGLFTLFLWLISNHEADAQTWKPICVNGGNTTGAHNSTWQKINSNGAGGTTWKRIGQCTAPPPPAPPPFDGVAIDTFPFALNRMRPASTEFQLAGDGTWLSSWNPQGYNMSGSTQGRWLANGHNSSDYDVQWQLLADDRANDSFLIHRISSSVSQGAYYSLGNGFSITLIVSGGDYDIARSRVTVTIGIWIRKRNDPNISRFEMIRLSGWFDNGLTPG